MTSWYGVNLPRFPPRFFSDAVAAKRSSKSSGVKTTSVSSPFAKRSLTSLRVFRTPRSARAHQRRRSSAECQRIHRIVRNLRGTPHHRPCNVLWSTEVASPRSLESGSHHGGRGSPVLLHEGSDLEVRAMTDDVQYWQGLTAQGKIKHVQSNDTVELIRAWFRSLPRRLGPRVGVTVRTSISTSDVLEHYGFCVSSLQHFEKFPSRRMSQVSMGLIYHLGLRFPRLQVVGWRVTFVEPRVRVPPVICWLIVLPHYDVRHHRIVRHEGGRLAV